jgi:hypothetical protein
MRKLVLTYAVFLCTLTVAGQAERATADLPGMVNRGLNISTRGAYRYTLKIEQNKTVIFEVDSQGSLRVKDSDDRTGVISECVIIGERIYHRWGDYPWISQTKDEFEKAQAALGAAVKEARAKKDTEAFQRAKSATLNNPAIFRALWKPASNAVVGADSSGMSDKSIAFLGNLRYKDKLAVSTACMGTVLSLRRQLPVSFPYGPRSSTPLIRKRPRFCRHKCGRMWCTSRPRGHSSRRTNGNRTRRS